MKRRRDPIHFLQDILENARMACLFIEDIGFPAFKKNNDKYMPFYELLRLLGRRLKKFLSPLEYDIPLSPGKTWPE
jgi:hypothetical protein